MASVIRLTAVGSQVLIVERADICSGRPAGVFTLPKLPLPSTMRKLKSWIPILTFAGPTLWMGGQGRMGVGVMAAGKDSDSGTGIG